MFNKNILSAILVVLLTVSVFAGTRTAEFPYNLTPGMSRESTLAALGDSVTFRDFDIYTDVGVGIFSESFYNDQLWSIQLYFGSTDSSYKQQQTLISLANYIDATYSDGEWVCYTLDDLLLDEDLQMTVVAVWTDGTTSIHIYSAYYEVDQVYAYDAILIFVNEAYFTKILEQREATK